EPIVFVTWFEAAQYCRWLSQVERIPDDEICYPPIDQIKEGRQLPSSFLTRTGYRLPTEQEWEYACRAGAVTSRAFGGSDEMLGNYAWYMHNSAGHPWPVGQLKPNDFGLFDMYGNAGEWCHDRALRFVHRLSETLFESGKDPGAGADNQLRVWRGGAFAHLAAR